MAAINRGQAGTVFIFMDFQNYILENFLPPERAEQVVKQAEAVLAAARKAGCFIIHVAVCFRPGYPEINGRNKMFSWIRDSNMADPSSRGIAFVDRMAPQPEEPVVQKRRVGAFGSTDLDMILRAKGIEKVFLAGVATSHVVLTTFNQAFDLDYDLTVIHDACADGDETAHVFLTETFFPKLGNVLSSRDVLAFLEG
ncbi:cysteine hydrolase family protein [Bombella intestini]|uniref:cysteine hydrolase family protein n=1 Tax=Bombella intestini TaxID=1539051 RepID=UPI000985AC0A|nr:cysteine hydrolase [Bombella intestini]